MPPATGGTTALVPWYRPDVDGLRAVAIVLVVGFHAGLPGFAGGFIGVDIFFVISGFVIAGLLAREHREEGRISWSRFYTRRIRRLLPAALVMVAAVLLMSALVLRQADLSTVAMAAISAVTSTANVYYWWLAGEGAAPNYFDQQADAAPLLHTWSLSVEEQFYLAVPVAVGAVVLLARRTGWRRRRVAIALVVLVSLLSVALSWWLTAQSQSAAFYLPFTRAFEFGFGALLAVIARAPRRTATRTVVGVGGTALVVVALVWPAPTVAFPGVQVAIPCLGAALLIASRPRPLAFGPMAALGRVSYGWYLWHVPVLALAEAWNLAPVGRAWSLVLVVAALGVAVLSHRYVELPWRRPRPGRSRRRTLATALAATLVVACTGAGMASADEAPASPYADFETAPDACRAQPALPMPTTLSRCELTPFDPDRPTVVLRGDSHAWHYVPALLVAQREHPDVNLVAWTLPSCPPMDLPQELGYRFRAALASSEAAGTAGDWSQCVLLNHYARLDVAGLRSRGGVVVLAAGRWPGYLEHTVLSVRENATVRRDPRPVYEELVRDVVTAGLTGLLESPNEVTLVGPTPEPRRHVPRCLEQLGWPGRCDVSRGDEDAYLAGSREWLAELADRHGGVRIIDVSGELCDDEACRAQSDGLTNYVDDSHLSRSRAELLAPYFEDVFDGLDQ